MASRSHGNPLLAHPGWTAAIFTVVVLAGFLGMIYNNATGAHHAGGEGHGSEAHPAAGEAHPAAGEAHPAGSAAHPAAAGSASAAHH